MSGDRTYAQGYSNGYAAARRRATAEMKSEVRRMANAEYLRLRNQFAASSVDDDRAELSVLLPDNPRMVNIRWPQDISALSAELTRDMLILTLNHWIEKRRHPGHRRADR